MDQQTLIDAILREARRDCFNGVGRIFVDDFLRTYEVDETSFLNAIQEMQKLWKGVKIERSSLNDNIFLFHLADSQISLE